MEITVTPESFRLAEVFTISRGSRTEARVLTVHIKNGEFEGRGECLAYARYGWTEANIIEQVMNLPENFTRDELQVLLPAGTARNAVDVALWDIEAKQTGQRVWQIAGLAEPKPVTTAFTLSLAGPEKMLAAAAANAHRPLLKIKLGTPDDMVRLEAVRRGAPKSEIIVDANEGWTAEVYTELAPHLLRLGVSMVEQPMPAGDDGMLAEIERPLPVCADESCLDRSSLAGLKGKYDIINIKLDKAGGLTEALALKKQAIAEGFEVMVGCMMGSSLAMAPAVLVAQDVAFTDLDGPLLLAEDRDNALQYEGAKACPPVAALWG